MTPDRGKTEVDFELLYQRLAAAEQALLDEAGDQGRETILLARGEVLAKARAEEEHISLTVMAFRLAGARYGVPFVNLEQIVECQHLCPLQGAPRAVSHRSEPCGIRSCQSPTCTNRQRRTIW